MSRKNCHQFLSFSVSQFLSFSVSRFLNTWLLFNHGCVRSQVSEGGERQRVMCVELVANRFLRRVRNEVR